MLTRKHISTQALAICLTAPIFFTQLSFAEDEAIESTDKEKKKEEVAKDEAKPVVKPSRIYLTNGDRLSGKPHSIDAEGNLLFSSDSLNQTASFPRKNILSLELGKWQKPPTKDVLARVKLQPRYAEQNSNDVLTGTLSELTADSITLDTWYAGIIKLDRTMVQELNIISNRPGNYYGPNNIQEWNRPSGKDTWSFKSGVLSSHGAKSIGRDVGMKTKTHLSFMADWRTSMRFKVQLFNDDTTDASPSSYSEISFQSTYATLRVRGNRANGARLNRGGGWKRLNFRPTVTRAKFDIYADNETGSFTIYIDGKLACTIQGQAGADKPGTGLAFLSESRYPLKISNITVLPWNGTSLPNAVKAEEKEEDPANKKPHRIILANGDEVPGTVGKVKDGKMLIETDFTPINIPISRIKSLSLGSKDNEPRRLKGDVRAYFHRGGHVTMRLESFSEGKVTGYSQAFGKATFQLAAFSRIDFHIYDDEANQLREKQ